MKKEDFKIYVGTYGKYNAGSLFGEWLNVADYDSKDEFLEACAELHKNEYDPEYMFQDFEFIPIAFISESWVDERLWEFLEEVPEYELEAFFDYADNQGFDDGISYDDFKKQYCGKWYSLREYIDNMADELWQVPDYLRNYFDYNAYYRDNEHAYWISDNGHVFNN